MRGGGESKDEHETPRCDHRPPPTLAFLNVTGGVAYLENGELTRPNFADLLRERLFPGVKLSHRVSGGKQLGS